MTTQPTTRAGFVDTPNLTIQVGGTSFAYRDLGPRDGVPLILFHHLTAVLDNWDPRVIDGLAAGKRVIALDNRGIGASEGTVPDTIEAMADDGIAFIRALGFAEVDLLGLSMGGFVTQVIALKQPRLVRRMILAGTGPAGGTGIDKVTRVTLYDMLRAALNLKDPKPYLFFTRSARGRQAAAEFLARLKERTEDRDQPISVAAFRRQLKAVHRWGLQPPADLSQIGQPVLVVNGDSDRMVPTSNSVDMAKRLPNSELVLYEDSGHMAIFQHHADFVRRALHFLGSAQPS
jgi:pimeloyl-ACP methyl ester carboxylesterase